MVKTDVSDDVIVRLRKYIMNKHGQVYGHLRQEIDIAITERLNKLESCSVGVEDQRTPPTI